MACHNLSFKKAKKQGEMQLPSSVPSHFKKNGDFRDGMGLRLGMGFPLDSFLFLRGGV